MSPCAHSILSWLISMTKLPFVLLSFHSIHFKLKKLLVFLVDYTFLSQMSCCTFAFNFNRHRSKKFFFSHKLLVSPSMLRNRAHCPTTRKPRAKSGIFSSWKPSKLMEPSTQNSLNELGNEETKSEKWMEFFYRGNLQS